MTDYALAIIASSSASSLAHFHRHQDLPGRVDSRRFYGEFFRRPANAAPPEADEAEVPRDVFSASLLAQLVYVIALAACADMDRDATALPQPARNLDRTTPLARGP